MSATKLCQGCLSSDRNLTPLGKHIKLYLSLIKTKSILPVKRHWMFCWECHKIMDNIQAFSFKITQAQKLLYNRSLLLDKYNTLSNLTIVNDFNKCKLIVYEDMKDLSQELGHILKYEVVEELKIETQDVAKGPMKNDTPEKDDDDFKIEAVKFEDSFDEAAFADTDVYENKDEDFNIKQELDEEMVDIESFVEHKSKRVPNKKKEKIMRPAFIKPKYKNVILDEVADKRSLYYKISLDEKGLHEWMEKKRQSTSKKKFQCQQCYCGFSQQKFYDRHLAVRHAKRHNYECAICGFRFAEKSKLSYHVRCHYELFACRLCDLKFYTRPEIYVHLIHGPHGRQRECLVCGMRFDCNKRKEFFQHYRYMHEYHICDYCGRNFTKKKSLIAHISVHHTVHHCKTCDVRFGSYTSYVRHNKEKHVVEAGEQNYCVECNMQFINSAKYNTHLKRSVKHRPTPAIPCPECGKVYTKKISMANHYNLVHLKKSKYHCALCDTYYLTGHRLRYHQKYFHEKRPKPKNKICKYCGKGFNNNRMLTNHIRTHTGERPFACTRCPAAFTQKQSLSAHERAAHK